MKKTLGLALSLTIISAVCAAVLAYVNLLTKEPIAAINVQKTVDAAKAVMPAGVATVEKMALAGGAEGFVGRDAKGEIIGYAVEGRDPKGYGGDIVLMVGFRSDKKTIVCYRMLAASETPGLGMKLKDPSFADQFVGKDAPTLKVVKTKPKEADEIQAITSATITSKAVCRAVQSAAAKF